MGLMVDWKSNKDSGPWDFTEQPNKWGYLNNPRWSNRQDSVDFCAGLGLEVGEPSEHAPCGHWHKNKYFPMPVGKWVAAMQQPGTPYIYLYNIGAKAVIRVNTAFVPPIVDGVLRLNSIYNLDYDMGWGNPGAQRGGYCMNKDGTRIWYLFTKSDGDRSDAELIEVNITSYYMKKVKSTLFPNLVPSEAFPSIVNERINDGCSDDTHTYWCTNLVAGRIIKIRNSDHSIIDNHTFNYTIEGCSGGVFDEAIVTIDVNKDTGKLYWVYCRDRLTCVPAYNACRHFIRADIDLVADIDEVVCGSGIHNPAYQNMIRIYSNHILHQRGYHSFSSPLYKRTLDLSKDEMVAGTAFFEWVCMKTHTAIASNRPTSGADYDTYWTPWDERLGGSAWQVGQTYHSVRISQEYLQNILGVKNNKLFTLMCVNSVMHPAFLYCIDFSNIGEISRLDVSYYAGQRWPDPYIWDWTSVSAMNQQTGVIAIFRYNNAQLRNYAGCFSASPSLEFLCDTRFERVYDDPTLGPFGEPQSWPLEGFTAPPVPSTDPPVQTTDPNPGPGEVPYVPPPPPPNDVPDDGVTLLQSGFTDYFDIGPGQALFFRFVVPASDHSIQVHNTSQSQEPHTVHLLIGKNRKPTIADFEHTWGMSASQSGIDGLYFNYNTGARAELVEIRNRTETNTFYIMLYNNGTRSVRNQRLILYYYE